MSADGPALEAISPLVAVTNLEESIAFYTQTLGFELRDHAPENDYALVVSGGVGICLLGGADEASAAATRQHVAAYIWVKDLDGVWSGLVDKLSRLPEGRVRPPFKQDYGAYEFHVKDPDGFLMFFGQQ